MMGMKVSVSLPVEDVEFLDSYAHTAGYESRSSVLHQAIRLLRTSQLGDAYADAWREWRAGGDAEVWEPSAADGVTP
jgi:Arc/MetJ-type ribon-helix-helix transcriptional regulator